MSADSQLQKATGNFRVLILSLDPIYELQLDPLKEMLTTVGFGHKCPTCFEQMP